MSQYFQIHPDNPQPRLIRRAAQLLHAGGICAVPTDSSYALVCHLDDKAAAEALRRLREVDAKHHLTLLCRDLSELASYALVCHLDVSVPPRPCMPIQPAIVSMALCRPTSSTAINMFVP